jgi:hypothetical protein
VAVDAGEVRADHGGGAGQGGGGCLVNHFVI